MNRAVKNYLRVQCLNQPNLRYLMYQLTAVGKELPGHKKESYILICLFIYLFLQHPAAQDFALWDD